jgi:hypothetical protein
MVPTFSFTHPATVARAQEPEIRADDGKLQFVVPANSNVTIVYRNPDGTENAPVRIVTNGELDVMRAQMQALTVRHGPNLL